MEGAAFEERHELYNFDEVSGEYPGSAVDSTGPPGDKTVNV